MENQITFSFNSNASAYVEVKEGKAYTTSRIVAEKFGKEHRSVLRAIENLMISAEFRGLHKIVQSEINQEQTFILSSYLNEQHKEQPEYLITEEGAMLLIMGFTGEKALGVKLRFIEEFKRMKEYIHQMQANPIERIMSHSTNQLETARALTQMLEIEQQKQLILEAEKKAAVDYYEKGLDLISNKVEEIKQELSEAKEDYKGLYEGFISNDGWFAMEDVANRLAIKGMGRNKLFKFLRDKDILMSDNTPYRNYIDEGYFMVDCRVIQLNGYDKVIHKTLVSKSGMAFIEKKIRKEINSK